MPHFIQNSFNAGEWTPLLEGRVDLEKYRSACLRKENFLNDPHGPAMFRPGFRYIAGAKRNADNARLIPFEFSSTQAYIVEFGDEYIRFYRNQGQIQLAYSAWLTSTSYAVGALVTNGGNYYRCLLAHTSGTFATDLAANKWVLSAGATDLAYEIPSPYDKTDLAEIKFCQSADVLYLFHPEYAPRKLSRAGHTNWSLTTINFRPPAVSEQGLSPDTTLTLSSTSGSGVTFTAGASTFLSGDVGRVITSGAGRASIISFVSATVVTCDIIDSFSSVGPIASGSWALQGSPQGSVTPSAQSPVGAVINLTASGTAGTFVNLLGEDQNYWLVSSSGTDEYYLVSIAPGYTASQPSAVQIDNIDVVLGVAGSLGISQWGWGNNDSLGYNTIYVRLSDGVDPDTKSTVLAPNNSFVRRSTGTVSNEVFRSTDVGNYVRIHGGLVRITSFNSATQVTGEIVKELTSVDATTNWTLEKSVWSDSNGYPSCGTFFEDRLVLGGSTAFPETVWGSVVGDYENFTPGTDAADSFVFTLAGRQVNVIRWMEPREYLIIGTIGGEWRLGPEDTGQSLTPLNVVAKQERNYGSANVLPVTVSGSTLFVQRAGRKVREFTFQWEQDGYVAPDITLLAEHITASGIQELVYQQEPFSIVWARLANGSLIAMTYLREQDIVGWDNHPISGDVESLAVIPGTGYDEVWAIIKRTINGNTVRYVEMMEEVFRDTPDEYAANKGLNAFFVDAGKTYSGSPTTTITGLGHLEGEEVAVLADGYVVSGKTVTGGQITLSTAASVVHVGLGYRGLLQTMRLDTMTQTGTAQGRPKKINEIHFRVYASGCFKAGRDENNLDVVFDPERELILAGPYPLFTGDIRFGYDANWDKAARMFIVQDKPLPLTLIANIVEASIS